jgi:hypothetical protein
VSNVARETKKSRTSANRVPLGLPGFAHAHAGGVAFVVARVRARFTTSAGNTA